MLMMFFMSAWNLIYKLDFIRPQYQKEIVEMQKIRPASQNFNE